MKNKLILILSLSLIFSGCNSSKRIKCDSECILMPPKNIKIPLYNKYNSKTVNCIIVNDTITEEYYSLHVIKIKREFALVEACTPFDTIKKVGWINIKYLGIYPSNFLNINLYCKPDLKSKIKSQIIKPEYYPFNILDCSGEWLYVKYFDADKKYKKGWLAPGDQCSNPYSTCN